MAIYSIFEAFFIRVMSFIGYIFSLLPGGLGDPFEYLFMQRALLTAILVGVVCGILSNFIVLKKWALLGDSISHAVLPGVAFAYLLGLPFAAGAFVAGLIAAGGMSFIEINSRIKEDAAMGIILTSFFAAGVIIISRIATSTHLMHILFGNVLGVQMDALILTAIISLITLFFVKIYFNELLIYTFDPIQASALGLNRSFFHYGLMFLITMTIVASLETVGIILVVAMLITPGATAYLLTDRLSIMILISSSIGFVSSVVGLYVSFAYNVASGASIVIVMSIIFMVILIMSPKYGILKLDQKLQGS